MESLTKCASCGKIPRQQDLAERGEWNESTQLDVRPAKPDQSAGAAPAGSSGEAPALRDIFDHYCNRAPKSDAIDNSKWAKALTDLQWIDARVTKTDGDLIFTKVKDKGARKMDFDTFVEGVKEVAKRRHPNDGDALTKLLQSTTLPSKQGGSASPNVVDRLTDTSKFTGTHKARFDEDGKGKGLDGRDANLAGDKLIVGKVLPGGKKINLAESLREDVDGSLQKATHCPQCGAKRASDQRSCARCGKQFY